MPLILIADDDRQLVCLLEEALARQYLTVNASDGASVLHLIGTEQPDLILLDLGLPDVDGGVLILKIRQTSPVPIIVLSGRDTQADRVMTLKAGADDFLGKPFDLDELEARIEVVLRRSRRIPVPHGPQPLVLGALSITTGGQFIDGSPIHITPTERVLLTALVERAGEVVKHEDLSLRVVGVPSGYRHLVDIHISRLRARLRLRRAAPTIETVRGRGFRLIAPEVP